MMVSITRAAAMMNKSPAILASSVGDVDVVDYLRISRKSTAPACELGVGAGVVAHDKVGGSIEAVERNSFRTTNKPRMTVVATHSGDNPKSGAGILYLRQLRLENRGEL